MKMTKYQIAIGAVGLVVVLVLAIVMITSNRVSSYPLSCDIGMKDCKALSRSTWILDKKAQQVVQIRPGTIQTFKKCEIANRRNWSCDWWENYSEFGFAQGEYFSRPSAGPGFKETNYFNWMLKKIF